MKHLIGFILISGVILGAFIIFSLIKTKKDTLPQRLLIAFWVIILGIFFHFYGQLNELEFLRSITYPLINVSQMFLPVLVFLYLKSIFFHEGNFFRKNFWHFAPTTIYFLFYTFPYFIDLFAEPPIFKYPKQIDLGIITLLKTSYGLIYFIFSLRLLSRIRKQLRHLYSYLNQRHFFWLNAFLIPFFSILIIDFSFTLSEFLFDYTVEWDGYITVLLLIITMFCLAYYGIKQFTLFIPEFLAQDKEQALIISDNYHELEKKLKALLEKDQVYLIPNLTLNELSKKMGTSDKMLSQFLNNFINESFYDLINRYRVEEAKKKLISQELETYSISGIGSMCGFSSKSSFYRVFKKETGLTPLNYKKQFEK